MSLTKVSYSMINGAETNVLDFGADPTGILECSSNIQAAINATAAKVTGGAIYIPSGTYKISTALDVPYGVSIYGDSGVASILACYDCDGLHFVSNGYDIGRMFYEDFGITGMSGINKYAIKSVGTTASQDGLQFNRLRIFDFEYGFYLGNDRTCTIQNCRSQKVTLAVWLQEEALGIFVLNNTFVYEGGCSRAGSAESYGVFLDGPIVEGVIIQNNEIFGFGTCVRINFVQYAVIQNNVLSSTVYSVFLNSTASTVAILNNYIEVAGNDGIGIYGGGLASPSNTVTTIQSNAFVCALGTDTVGIQLNDAGNTNRFYNRIIGNWFFGFTKLDIFYLNGGSTIIDGNKCSSDTPTSSIFISTVALAPITIINNWCYKAITFSNVADYTDGKIVSYNNAAGDVYQLGKSSASPTTGTWLVGDIVYNSAPATGGYIGWVCTVAGTSGTWKPFGLIA